MCEGLIWLIAVFFLGLFLSLVVGLIINDILIWERRRRILKRFKEEINKQKPLPEEFKKIIEKHFWDLI